MWALSFRLKISTPAANRSLTFALLSLFQSPPPSPTLESARERAFTSIPKGNQNLHRSNTIAGPPTSGYSTLRKKGSGGPAPKPIGIPNPAKSPSRSISSTEVPYDDTRDSLNSSSGNVSNFSSMSSLSTASGDQLASDANQGNQVTPTFGDEMREQVAYYTQHDAKAMMLGEINVFEWLVILLRMRSVGTIVLTNFFSFVVGKSMLGLTMSCASWLLFLLLL